MTFSNCGRRLLYLTVVIGVAIPALSAAEAAAPEPATPTVAARPAFGTIVGVVRNGAKLPVGGATVTAMRMDGASIRATISATDGLYSFADLQPGAWSITSQAEGYSDTPAVSVDVTAGKASRSDIVMAGAALISSAAPVSAARTTLAPVQSKPPSENILSRLIRADKAKQPTQTASLNTPVSAFDRAALDVPTPAPDPAIAPAPPLQIPEALSAPESTPGVDNFTPFAYGDFTWMNGTSRNKDTVLDTKYFTPEIRFDTNFINDFNQPKDHTMGGSTEEFRNGEFQIEDIGIGGDFHWQNVRGRVMFMDGLFATTTPRNDASSATGNSGGNTGGVGQWDLQNSFKYVSEAYGGYHFNVNHGLNVDAGIFVSYVGLFSYYNFDNWTYQPSYVSSNTPWFFEGVRIQWFPTNKLKIEPWIVNGWQSYAKFNGHVGLGGQLLWEPKEWFKLVANQYGFGQDNLGLPHTQRIHTDDSVEVRYYNHPEKNTGIDKMAFSFTADAGCQYGGGITCHNGPNKSSFLGWMAYDRIWWHKDTYAVTLGGGQMNNTGRYLTLLPPIDGAWASVGSAYFPQLPGQPAHMWDSTITFHWMPRQYITWWAEAGYRHSDVPYFSGRGGITPPGGNNGLPQYYTCNTGASAGTADPVAAAAACGTSGVWQPDLRRSTSSLGFGVMVKF